jgi:hypothetical protein
MELRFPSEAEAFREQVRSFLSSHLPDRWAGIGSLDDPGGFLTTWRALLQEERLLAVSWPVEYGGGGRGPLESVIVAEELARVGLRHCSPNDAAGIEMLGNTLLRYGTDEQKARLLPRILSGEDRWCQGYSEPDAGSDLAAIRCRAVMDGDEWVIDGQKIWTSAGHLANWIFVLCRTDPAASRHRGLSLLLCPMDQPGVEVRPIRMLNGRSEFNEVYFSGARTAAGNVVGPLHAGWPVAMTLLGFERGEAAASQSIELRAEIDRLVALARSLGRSADPRVRDRLAWCYSQVEAMRYLGLRLLSDVAAGRPPGPESSGSKLLWSEYHRAVSELAVDILGMNATAPSGRAPATVFGADDGGAPNSSGSWVGVFLNSRAGTIYSGTSEIQRNIIAERVLGLPRPP